MSGPVPRIEEAPDYDWDAEEAAAAEETERMKRKNKQQREAKGGAKNEGPQLDPLVAIMMKDEVVELCSSLIAKLELLRFDEERTTVFKTPWVSDLFHSCLKRLAPNEMAGFNIESWYNEVVSKDCAARPSSGRCDYRISPALTSQAVQTNWLHPLFELEIRAPGFLKLFYNHLILEEKTHGKRAKGAKEETEYNWIQAGSMRGAVPLTITGPRNPAASTPLITAAKR